MAKRSVENSSIFAIANALRNKTFSEEKMIFPEGFINIIENIPTVAALLDRSITSINAPNVKTLTQRIINDCENLISVYLPDVETIESYGIYKCPLIESIIFPSVKTLNMNSLRENAGLKLVDFFKLETISTSSFFNCSSLEAVIIRSDSVATLGHISAFNGTPIVNGEGYIYVPRSMVDVYRTETNWITYADYILAIEDYPEITGGAI